MIYEHPSAKAILQNRKTTLATKIRLLYELSPAVFSTSALAHHFKYSQAAINTMIFQNRNGIHPKKHKVALDKIQAAAQW